MPLPSTSSPPIRTMRLALPTGTPTHTDRRSPSSDDLDSDSESGSWKSLFGDIDEGSSFDGGYDPVLKGDNATGKDNAEERGEAGAQGRREWGTDEDFGTQNGYFNAAAPLEFGTWGGPLPLVPWATQISFNENSSQLFGIGDKTANEQYMRIADEAPRFILGPMPVAAFTERFLRLSDVVKKHGRGPPVGADAFSKVSASGKSESSIYTPLMQAMNDPKRCPGITFRNTSNSADSEQGERGSCKPDICGYRDEHLELVKRPASEDESKALTHMGYAMLPVEIKKNAGFDPFLDPPPGISADKRAAWQFVLPDTTSSIRNSDRRRALGQCVKYAAEMLARQHRHCCYTVCVFGGSCVRLVRWDRAGAIVTEAIDLHRSPELLADFLWAYGSQTDAMKGYDLSVRSADAKQTEFFKQVISIHIKRQQSVNDVKSFPQALAEHFQAGSVSIMRVPVQSDAPDAHEALFFDVLVCRPVVYPLSVTGRGTRGYWAVYWDPRAEPHRTGRVCFLKDTWRFNARVGDDSEACVLQDLVGKGVQNVPEVVHFGDIPMYEYASIGEGEDVSLVPLEARPWQTTVTQDYTEAEWLCGLKSEDRRLTVYGHTHHRMTLNIAGYPLLRFTGTRELMDATRQVFQALVDAWCKANRFHRDVSAMNIVIIRHHNKGDTVLQAYLVDWDSSRSMHARTRDEYPISTCWQFTCEALCTTHPGKPIATHKLEYDVESLIWVILYCAVMWLPHNKSAVSIETTIRAIFDASSTFKPGFVTGGNGKNTEKWSALYTEDFEWTSKPFDRWLRAMMNVLRLLDGSSADPGQLRPAAMTSPITSSRQPSSPPPQPVPEPTRWHPLEVMAYWDDCTKRHAGALSAGDRRVFPAETTVPKLSNTVAMREYAATTPAPTPSTGKRLASSEATGVSEPNKRQRVGSE